MYEKNGLMSKLTDKDVLAYLRSRPEPNLYLVETAIRKKLKLEIKTCSSHRGRLKKMNCPNAIPVKVADRILVDYVVRQKTNHGINHRHTIESAIKKYMIGA